MSHILFVLAAASRGRCCHTNCAAVQDDVLATAMRLAKRRRWDLIHFALLDWLARQNQIDWTRAVADSCSVRAVCGGSKTGPNPTDRTKQGSKRHIDLLAVAAEALDCQLNTDRLAHPPKESDLFIMSPSVTAEARGDSVSRHSPRLLRNPC